MKRFYVTIKGEVQGVFFRKFIKNNAIKLNLTGWVKNNKSGVEAVFEGKAMDLHKMILLCRKGPPNANVKNLNFKEETVKNETKFVILK
ncbi:MAG: acylphosphatase [Nanoarchaeota archaeon]|nr:acylphosphatase [Nanoarchaeota archaeon]|tara:strand:- start:1309 stop:1575 length:267 start_codon:yes stop_codon:yes gene_type:complete